MNTLRSFPEPVEKSRGWVYTISNRLDLEHRNGAVTLVFKPLHGKSVRVEGIPRPALFIADTIEQQASRDFRTEDGKSSVKLNYLTDSDRYVLTVTVDGAELPFPVFLDHVSYLHLQWAAGNANKSPEEMGAALARNRWHKRVIVLLGLVSYLAAFVATFMGLCFADANLHPNTSAVVVVAVFAWLWYRISYRQGQWPTFLR